MACGEQAGDGSGLAVATEFLARGVRKSTLSAFSWEDEVAPRAGWALGSYEARRAEISFELDGIVLPPLPPYYRGLRGMIIDLSCLYPEGEGDESSSAAID